MYLTDYTLSLIIMFYQAQTRVLLEACILYEVQLIQTAEKLLLQMNLVFCKKFEILLAKLTCWLYA